MNVYATRDKVWIAVVVLITAALFQNCAVTESPISTGDTNRANSQKYFQTTPRLVIEVFYEPGAEPFAGTSAQGTPYWNILEENLASLFQYRSSPPVLIVPKNLASMRAIPAQNKSAWTGIDLMELNARTAFPTTENESRFQIYFLKGYFSNGSGAQNNVIGVSLSGTTVIGMFKQVIESSGHNPNGPVPKFVEQSTLVHEMGHALGFVNNGVPMTSSYQDVPHGSHSMNSECVMYWQNEGMSSLAQFVQKYLVSASKVMWGPEVLRDAQALSR